MGQQREGGWQPEKVREAAIWTGPKEKPDLIFTGNSHAEAYMDAEDAGHGDKDFSDGFTTTAGNVVDRRQASVLAERAGQLHSVYSQGGIPSRPASLLSEDLPELRAARGMGDNMSLGPTPIRGGPATGGRDVTQVQNSPLTEAPQQKIDYGWKDQPQQVQQQQGARPDLAARNQANARWTTDHDQQLRDLNKQGLGTAQIADRMGFGAATIARRASMLDLSLKTTPNAYGAWGKPQYEQLDQLSQRGLSADQIAVKMGFSKAQIFKKMAEQGYGKYGK
jgi:hypothetical protein